MYPESSLAMRNAGTTTAPNNSANLYSSISGAGLGGESSMQASQEVKEEANPAEMAIQRFGQVFETFNTLIQTPEYAVANTQAEKVKAAMKEWLEVVVSNVSPVGGESSY